MIFPEGSTSNLKYIRRFARGAFAATDCSVTPMSIDYGRPFVHPANEIVEDLAGLILQMSTI